MKGKRGFSLIEIVVVLMIFAILAALAWPALTNYYRDSNEEIYLAEGDKVLTAALDLQEHDLKISSLLFYPFE